MHQIYLFLTRNISSAKFGNQAVHLIKQSDCLLMALFVFPITDKSDLSLCNQAVQNLKINVMSGVSPLTVNMLVQEEKYWQTVIDTNKYILVTYKVKKSSKASLNHLFRSPFDKFFRLTSLI